MSAIGTNKKNELIWNDLLLMKTKWNFFFQILIFLIFLKPQAIDPSYDYQFFDNLLIFMKMTILIL